MPLQPSTPDELIAAMGLPRLVPQLVSLGWAEMVGLFGFGLLAGLAIATALSPFLGRRISRRARVKATRGQPPQERILAIARILGRLPDALRPAAYGAAPAPPDNEIERLARHRQ